MNSFLKTRISWPAFAFAAFTASGILSACFPELACAASPARPLLERDFRDERKPETTRATPSDTEAVSLPTTTAAAIPFAAFFTPDSED